MKNGRKEKKGDMQKTSSFTPVKTTTFMEFLESTVGAEFVGYAAIIIIVLMCLSVYFTAKGLYYMFIADPLSNSAAAQSATMKKAKKAKKGRSDKQQQKGEEPEEDDDNEDEQQEGGSNKNKSATTRTPQIIVRERSRPLSVVSPTSSNKQFKRVGVLAVSPCQRYLLISCRRAKCVRLYPQGVRRAFMEHAKELSDANALATFSGGELGTEQPEVSFAAFSADGEYLALGESTADTIYVFCISSPKMPIFLWSYKMPNHALVSAIHDAIVFGRGGALLVGHREDAVLEMVRQSGPPITQKFKIGNCLAWALSDPFVAAAGSQLRDCRLRAVNVRGSGDAFSLGHVFDIPHHGNVAALALTSPDSPSCNWRRYLVIFTKDGKGFIYDVGVDPKVYQPVLASCFEDADFAGGVDGMTISIGGAPHHEVLQVALWASSDVVVFRQSSGHKPPPKSVVTAPDVTVFTMDRLMDFHNAHGGEPVRTVVFVQNGHGMATCGFNDIYGVRFWTLPE